MKIPYICGKMLQTFLDIRNILFQNIYPNNFKMPVKFMISLDDKICDPEFALQFYNDLKNGDKYLKLFDFGKHEFLHDEEYPDALESIDQWIESKNQQPVLFSAPKYVKFNYSTFDWKNYLKVMFFVIFIVYIIKKQKNIISIILQLIGLKKN